MRELRIRFELAVLRAVEFDHRNEVNVEHGVNEGPELAQLFVEHAPHVIGTIFN